MASSMIVNIIGKADTTGTDKFARSMNDIQQSFVNATAQSASFGQSLGGLRNILVGGVMSLPLVGYIKEAIDSEEVTARFAMRLRSFGEDAGSVMKQVEGLTDRVHKAGITQTELIRALQRGSTYFKSMEQEVKLLDTAIGMTRVSGTNLETAFRQLGMIQQGNTRIARLYGVAMHNEIRNPTERAAAVMADFTKKMEPMSKQTGTTAEAMKQFGATIKDIGESVVKDMVVPIGELVKMFNNLDPAMQKTIVTTALLGTTLLGVTKILQGLSALKLLGGLAAPATVAGLAGTTAGVGKLATGVLLGGKAIGAAAASLAGTVALFLGAGFAVSKAVEYYGYLGSAEKIAAAEAEHHNLVINATLGELGKEVSMFDDAATAIAQLTAKLKLLKEQYIEFNKSPGGANQAANTKAEMERAENAINIYQKYLDSKDHNFIKSEESLNEWVYDNEAGKGAYKIARAKEQIEIALLAQKTGNQDAIKEEKFLNDTVKRLEETRINEFKAKFKEASKDAKGIDFQLMKAEDQAKFNAELEITKSIVKDIQSQDDIGKKTDKEKELLQTKAGQIALDERLSEVADRESKRRAAQAEWEDNWQGKWKKQREENMKVVQKEADMDVKKMAVGERAKKMNEEEAKATVASVEEKSKKQDKSDKAAIDALMYQSRVNDDIDKKKMAYFKQGKSYEEELRKETERVEKGRQIGKFEARDIGFSASEDERRMQEKDRRYVREEPLKPGVGGGAVGINIPVTLTNTFHIETKSSVDETINAVRSNMEEANRKAVLEVNKKYSGGGS